MPKIIEQPDDTGLVPRLNDARTSRNKLRIGHNKWDRIQHDIEHVLIGRRKYWTDEALAAYVRRQTHKPAALEPKPRRAAPRKAVAKARLRAKGHKVERATTPAGAL